MKSTLLGSSFPSDTAFSSVDNPKVHDQQTLTKIMPKAVRTFLWAGDESVIINDDLSATVIEIYNDEVHLLIDVPE